MNFAMLGAPTFERQFFMQANNAAFPAREAAYANTYKSNEEGLP